MERSKVRELDVRFGSKADISSPAAGRPRPDGRYRPV